LPNGCVAYLLSYEHYVGTSVITYSKLIPDFFSFIDGWYVNRITEKVMDKNFHELVVVLGLETRNN